MATIQQQFKHIRSLITQYRYDEALKILYTIDHPKADEWIEKIYARQDRESQADRGSRYSSSESIFGSEPSSSMFGASSDPIQPERAEKPKPKNGQSWDDPTGDPWNPRMILSFGLISFIPLISVPLAFNWRRLGRKRWFVDTLLVSLGILLVLAVLGGGMLYAFVEGRTDLYPFLGFPLAAMLGVALAFTGGLVSLQTAPYKLWKDEGVISMVKYRYNFTNWLLSMPITAVFFLGGAYFMYGDILIPQVYENQDVTIQFPAGFQRWDDCQQESNHLCLYRVRSYSGTQYTSIILMTRDTEGFTTGAQFEEYYRQDLLADSDDVTIISVEDVTVDGQSIRVRTQKHGDDKCADYRQSMYFVRNGKLYQLNAYTTCQRLWDQYSDAIDRMMYGIQFH